MNDFEDTQPLGQPLDLRTNRVRYWAIRLGSRVLPRLSAAPAEFNQATDWAALDTDDGGSGSGIQ